ncbi:hypothetical protein F5878DRAFT_548785, partial [Lentinula raphanica]
MPREVETRIEKRIRKFLWDDKTLVRVNKETIYAPIAEGGRQLLDLLARNEAILVTWLRSYLNLNENRATWTYIADAILAHHVPSKFANLEERDKINTFLQSWTSNSSKLPKDLRDLISIAKKYGARTEGLAFSRNIIRQMPIWLHSEAADIHKLHNSKESRCLRQNHGVITVGDIETQAQKIRTPRHGRRRNCRCTACETARNECHCEAPYRCFSKANELLRTLPEKWNPTSDLPEDHEPHELQPPEIEGGITFDHRITVHGSLADAFRIFTQGNTINRIPEVVGDPQPAELKVEAYTDGSCQHNGSDDATAGAGIFYGEGNILNKSIRIPQNLPQTNQTGEIVSVKTAVTDVDPNHSL